ncbi:hypothetical protein ON010_g4457 [Phytophthora cinnamomi]|nr:hypothetical protein ON010_g4457 [Phytophthora cinnamomi]
MAPWYRQLPWFASEYFLEVAVPTQRGGFDYWVDCPLEGYDGIDEFHKRHNVSQAYSATSARIATLNTTPPERPPRVDIKVPVKVYFPADVDASSRGSLPKLIDLAHVEREVRKEWAAYEPDQEKRAAVSRSFQVTLVLEGAISSYEPRAGSDRVFVEEHVCSRSRGSPDPVSRGFQTLERWWKWLACGLFSRGARAHSKLESLALVSICHMSVATIEAFSALLETEHPEETLFNCAHGQSKEREATLQVDSPIRSAFDACSSPVLMSPTLILDVAVPFVRRFGDDGQSD